MVLASVSLDFGVARSARYLSEGSDLSVFYQYSVTPTPYNKAVSTACNYAVSRMRTAGLCLSTLYI